MWRVDHLPTNVAVMPETTWHATRADAMAEEKRLIEAGRRAVAWFDAQAPLDVLPRLDGRAMVREALQAAFGWLDLSRDEIRPRGENA